jgi:hypothetical protein
MTEGWVVLRFGFVLFVFRSNTVRSLSTNLIGQLENWSIGESANYLKNLYFCLFSASIAFTCPSTTSVGLNLTKPIKHKIPIIISSKNPKKGIRKSGIKS